MPIINSPQGKDPNLVANLSTIANIAEAACRTVCGIESDLISKTLNDNAVTHESVQQAVIARMAYRLRTLKTAR